jgi:hypothetical protein
VNDDPLPTVSVADGSVLEPDTGTVGMTFAVTLSPASGKTVTVRYATADTGAGPGFAIAGADYTARTGTITFGAGATSRTVTVSTRGDLLVEGEEVFRLTLAAPTEAAIGDGEAAGRIQDDE